MNGTARFRTLYQLLANKYPFDGQTEGQIYRQIFEMPAPSVRRARPQVPKALDAVISRCLEKRRSKRWQSVAELAEALMPFGSRSAEVSAEGEVVGAGDSLENGKGATVEVAPFFIGW